ncbi:MAG TPA: hypothetical protein VIM65_19185 [Cyclobacteriaceae bacterium]
MRNLLVIISLTISVTAVAQITYPQKKDKSVIRVNEFYSGCGKIFSDNKHYLVQSNAKSVTPTEEDILQAERLMNEKFSDLVKSDETLKTLQGKTYKDEYYKFYRQYVEVIDNEGHRIVLINYIKCCKRRIKKCFPDWKKELCTPLDEDPCTATISYSVNLSQQTISVY